MITIEHNPAPAKLEVMGVFDWPVWSKEESTFPWTYDQKETCYFLEGEVVVTPDGRYITSLFIVPEFVRGIRFAQFVQTSTAAMEVRVVPDRTWNEECQEQLTQYARRILGPTMQLQVRSTSREGLIRDASGKIRSVIGAH